MPAYVVVQIAVEDAEIYERYKELAPVSIKAYGGRYLVRGGAIWPLEGSWDPNRFVLLEFPFFGARSALVELIRVRRCKGAAPQQRQDRYASR